jgi:hypothetical protein
MFSYVSNVCLHRTRIELLPRNFFGMGLVNYQLIGVADCTFLHNATTIILMIKDYGYYAVLGHVSIIRQ